MIKPLLLIILCFFSSFEKIHKYYTSITQIEWNEKERSAEIIMNVFIDDFEKALSEQHKRKITYGTKDFDQTAPEYIHTHFSISCNNKSPVKLIGIQLAKDVASIYIEAEQIKTLNYCVIKNSMLTDIIDAQTNLVNIIEGKNKRTLILSKSHTQESIQF